MSNFCYRHSDRSSNISCTRCSRAICHECMISAPVGFQCPECSRGASSNVKVIRTSDSFWNSLPIVTRSIIATCVGAFLIAMATGGQLNAAYSFGMSPLLVAQGEWWRLVTSTFLHINIMHILFNMYALLVLGSSLERTVGHFALM